MARRAGSVPASAGGKRQGFLGRVRSALGFVMGGGAAEPAYDAGHVSRRTRGWRVGLSGPNSAATYALPILRNRSRDITRKVPLIAGAYETLVANIIGPGISIRPALDSEAFRAAFKIVFDDWCTYCDADGVVDLQGFLSLAVRGRLEGGEVFIRHRARRMADGFLVPYQIQLLEAEMVPVEMTYPLPNGNRIIAGIEVDKLGRRVAYHMYREHPGDAGLVGATGETIRVPASEVIHYYKPLRPGQMRGIPIAAPALQKIRDWGIYDEAELVRKQMAAMMAGFIESPADDTVNEDDEDPDADLGEAIGKLEPGMLMKLLPGEEIKFNAPAESGNSFDPYTKMVLRCIAAVFGLTYEQLTNDLSQVNFSSIRAGLNEAQRKFRMEQAHLIQQILRPVVARWMDTAVLAGVIAAPNYGFDKSKYVAATYQAPGWRYVNPQQEINAVKEEIKGGLNSRAAVAADMGRDITQVDAEIAADAARAEKLGLVFDTDPTMGKGAGGMVPTSDGFTTTNDNGGPPVDGDGVDNDGNKPEDMKAKADEE